MSKPGPKPKGKVCLEWSSKFAYAMGLIASDGNLSPDERHIVFVSKDRKQVENFLQSLNINGHHIGIKSSGSNREKKYFCTQIGDVLLYNFLNSIGLTKNKSKTIGVLTIPPQYFFDFLRGSFDGDGTFYSYIDRRWRGTLCFYTVFISASKVHIDWIREEIFEHLGIKGHITKSGNQACFQLKYGMKESRVLIQKMYENKQTPFLLRKKLKIMRILGIVGK